MDLLFFLVSGLFFSLIIIILLIISVFRGFSQGRNETNNQILNELKEIRKSIEEINKRDD